MLALAIAFWSQIDAPASVGSTMMMLAQPLRGATLDKAFYRVTGTLIGGVVALFLVALCGQERLLLLGGCALWMTVCAYIGTLQKGFRAYGSLLAGYVVALISVSNIDAPQQAFHVTIARVSSVMISVVSLAIVALLAGTPHVWRELTKGLQQANNRIRRDAELALTEQQPSLNAMETITLSSTVFSLVNQVYHARTELNKSRLRTKGAQVCLISMVTILSCCRSLMELMKRGHIHREVLELTTSDQNLPPSTNRRHVMARLLSRFYALDAPPALSRQDALRMERTANLFANRQNSRIGLNTLLKATPLNKTEGLTNFTFHPDHTAAFINAIRVLLCFSATAVLFLDSGIPHIATALSQCALLLNIAILRPDTASFGYAVLVGTPLGIITAGFTAFFVLPHITTFLGLSIVLLLHVGVVCQLILNPKTRSMGVHYGAFFFVFLGLNNHHNYSLSAFLDRNSFYFCAAIITALFLIFFFPPTPKKIRFRIALSIIRELDKQFKANAPAITPSLLSRKYDRLHQLYVTTKSITPYNPKHVAWKICERFISLADLTTAIAQLENDLQYAKTFPALRQLAKAAQGCLARTPRFSLPEHLSSMADMMLQKGTTEPGSDEHVAAALCAASMEETSFLLQKNRAALRHYGIGRTQ